MAEQEMNNGDDRELMRALLSGPAVGVPHAADEATRETFSERRMGQREAYGQFVATGDIYWPGTGTLVFTEGMQVPIEHVEKWLLEDADLVQRVASPRLARAGARFPAGQGGQVTGGDGVVLAEPHVEPTATPPAPSGEAAAEADEGGTEDKAEKPARSTRSTGSAKSAAAKSDDK